MHILYLDDDPRMESTLRRIVRRHGHSFEFCTSIQTCKIAVLALTPDLLLLDLGLGQESGLDLIEWLAITKQRIPVAFLSGYGDDLLDTAQRIAKARGIEVRGLVSKALLANDLMPLLNPHQPLQPLQPLHSPSIAPNYTALSHSEVHNPPFDAELLAERLKAGALEPFFQPIISLVDGRLCGAEVLARLRLADGSLLAARDFIPLAETANLIDPLTQDLFDKIILLRERLQPLDLNFLSVNLSHFTIEEPQAIELLQTLVTGLDGCCRVQVEITETWARNDRQVLRDFAARAQLMGASLAIDDFGTGYASLRNLAELPFNFLKIDLSFVSEMFDSIKAMTVLMAVISFGQRLGLKLIAEGVETEAQRDLLFRAGLDLAQGYLFGRPGSIELLEELCSQSQFYLDNGVILHSLK
ncbi:EAL domain-containing protein [Chromatium okenii]|uniref:EAL domain-containing protein n=1 Tax=Chromatium okenii TaxID=61644 RepID=UPI0026F1F512|nr:EAL domain-containing response regulator [Chromatium okenii]MBV5310427.1 EAL domain-containing response regulator [Chromatium okenii]